MKHFSKFAFVTVFVLAIIGQAFAGTTRKTVKSGESTVVYHTAFMGVPPKGIKSPQPATVQPENGTLKVKKEVTGTGRSKQTIYSFIYTSKKGYKGKDKAQAIMNYFIRRNNGSQTKSPRVENIIVRVR